MFVRVMWINRGGIHGGGCSKACSLSLSLSALPFSQRSRLSVHHNIPIEEVYFPYI